MDDDMVGTHTAVSGLMNVSPQLRASAGTAWTKKCNTQGITEADTQDVAHMDYTTADNERVDDLIRERQHHKEEMERLGTELHKLKEDIASLTATQEAQRDINQRREQWEQKMDTQLEESKADRKKMKKNHTTNFDGNEFTNGDTVNPTRKFWIHH